jgi:prevent-host-death family protein
MAMKRVGVAELKNQLSRYLREVEAGYEVEVTDRGRPIGRLTSPSRERQLPVRAATRPFATLRGREYPAAGWPRPSTDLLVEERQGR